MALPEAFPNAPDTTVHRGIGVREQRRNDEPEAHHTIVSTRIDTDSL